jgi:Leucine-rich repeat (LRR) protein
MVIWLLLAIAGGACIVDEPSGNPLGAQQQFQPSNPEANLAPLPDEIWLEMVRSTSQGLQDSLHVSGSSVSLRQIEALPFNPSLKELLLDGGAVDDKGLAAIVKACPRLERLRLRLSPVTEHGAGQLAKLTHLKILNLPQSRFSDQAISLLEPLKSLEQLRLGSSQLTDQAVEAIVNLPNLRSLHLIGPKLTDQALVQLATAPRLSSFYLDDCPLSEEAFKQLQRSKPRLHIHLDQDHADRMKRSSETE